VEVLSVEPGLVHFSEKWCTASDSHCYIRHVSLDRANGIFIGEDLDGSIFHTANLFPDGIFTRDSARQPDFRGHVPVDTIPAVGFLPEFRAGEKVYRDVTVFIDPTGIRTDIGGRCLLLAPDKRLLESYQYHITGIDSGWEAR
jgi:hypothetical protein